MLDQHDDAWRWRVALIDSARDSIDMQYYVRFGDAVGTLLMLLDIEHVALRDALVARIDSDPRIPIRVFNH